MNCIITNNPVGTDAWPVGRPCLCETCQTWLRASFKESIEPIITIVLDEGTPNSATEVHAVVLKAAMAAFQSGFMKAKEEKAPETSGIPSPDALY
jgi:hypothetical protein